MTAKKKKAASEKRDNFPVRVKEILAKRAGYRCSVPGCKRLTIGPNADPNKFTSTGVAAHIISASRDKGPRADPNVSSDYRKSIANGIWCCATHGMQIDSDESGHSVATLHAWKEDHETFIRLDYEDRFVGKGIVTSVKVENLGRFETPQTIRFSKKTLILGGNKTGKRLLCHMVSSLSNAEFGSRWQGASFKSGTSSAEIETFSTTKTTWKIHFGDRLIYNANGDPVPAIYSGIRVLQLDGQFLATGPSRSEFGRGDSEDPEEDEAWQKEWDSVFLDDLAGMFDLNRDGIITALKIMENTPGKFFADVRINGENLSWRVNHVNNSALYWSFGQLGGGERQFVILDIILRLAEYSAKFSPTILILNQYTFHSMDQGNLLWILEKLGKLELQCQLIVPLYYWRDAIPQENWAIRHLRSDSDHGPVTIHEGLPGIQSAKAPAKITSIPDTSQGAL